MVKTYLSILILTLTTLSANGLTEPRPLLVMPNTSSLPASTQRGASYFMQYCASCHSLNKLTYASMGQKIGLTYPNGEIDRRLLEKLMWQNQDPEQPITPAITTPQMQAWFGASVPDLSLIAATKSPRWLYTYLLSFYADPPSPLGTNNLLQSGTHMPNVFENLQGEQTPVFQQDRSHSISHLRRTYPGLMPKAEFHHLVLDTVNFLTRISQTPTPYKHELAFWLFFGLTLLAVLSYLWQSRYLQ